MLSVYLIILTIIVPFGLKNPHDQNNKRYYDLVKFTFLSSITFFLDSFVAYIMSQTGNYTDWLIIFVEISTFISLLLLLYLVYKLICYLWEDLWLIKEFKQIKEKITKMEKFIYQIFQKLINGRSKYF